MSDPHPANGLIHTVKFRLGDADHTRLAGQAAILRLRVNALARQLVVGKSRAAARPLALDPVIVVQLHDIGIRLRDMLSREDSDSELRARIGDLCLRIERIIDHAISGEDTPWFR